MNRGTCSGAFDAALCKVGVELAFAPARCALAFASAAAAGALERPALALPRTALHCCVLLAAGAVMADADCVDAGRAEVAGAAEEAD